MKKSAIVFLAGVWAASAPVVAAVPATLAAAEDALARGDHRRECKAKME